MPTTNSENIAEKKDIITKEQVEKIKSWLQSAEGKAKVIEVQQANLEVSRRIKEMNNYDISLMLRPYTI